MGGCLAASEAFAHPICPGVVLSPPNEPVGVGASWWIYAVLLLGGVGGGITGSVATCGAT
jgi:hypothetical protein